MNIKDTIKQIGLENETLPRILQQRVNTVISLEEKITLAEREVEDDPSEENKTKLQEIKDYYGEYFDDVEGQLGVYKSKLDAKKNKDVEVPNPEPIENTEKKGSGVGALLIGGILLVATLGAVNIMRKK